VRAALGAFGHNDEWIERCRGLVRGFAAHLGEGCLGTVAEIFEAEPPFRPVGAPAQAWSVAELLHLLLVDLADRPGLRRTEVARVERVESRAARDPTL
jgi:glycogen debranching enzyme